MRVAAVDEHVVGDGREHHRLDVAESPGSAIAVASARSAASARAGLDEAPVPRASRSVGHRLPSSKRRDREARRVVAGVAGDEREPVHEREGAVVGLELREHVGHRDEHGEPGAPAGVAVAGAEVDAACARSPSGRRRLRAGRAPTWRSRARGRPRARRRSRRCRCPTGSSRAARLARTRRRRRSSPSKPRTSSAQGSSVQPDTRSKRAWCQWQVTRPPSTVPWCSGKPMCGQRSSIAKARSVVPEHDDRQVADLGEQPPGGLQFGERPGTRWHDFEGMAAASRDQCRWAAKSSAAGAMSPMLKAASIARARLENCTGCADRLPQPQDDLAGAVLKLSPVGRTAPALTSGPQIGGPPWPTSRPRSPTPRRPGSR